MKHNLPAPSQPWGNDINKRLASVENDLMLIRSTANNAAQSVTSLVSDRATNGIAKPFYDEVSISSPGRGRGVGINEDIWYRSIPWADSGLFMQLAISGYLRIPLNLKLYSGYRYPVDVSVGVRGARAQDTRYLRCFLSYEPTGDEGRAMMVAHINYNTVIDYEHYKDGIVVVNMSNSSVHPEWAYNWDSTALLSLQIAGVRY